MSHRRGFTLIELLVAAAITAVMAASLGAVVSAALVVWQRLSRADRLTIRPQLALARWSADLRNSLAWGSLPFEGTPSRLAAAAVLPDPEHPGAWTVGRISYWLDDGGRLCRAAQPYAGWVPAQTPPCQVVATEVEAFALQYFGRDPDRQTWGWRSGWSEPVARPVAVQAMLTMRQPRQARSAAAQWTYVAVLPTTPTR